MSRGPTSAGVPWCRDRNLRARVGRRRAVAASRNYRAMRPRQLGWRRSRRWVEQDGFGFLLDLARNLAELAHPVRSKWKQDICQTGDVGLKGVTVFLDESTVVEWRLDSRPLVLCGDTRACVKSRRVRGRTPK
jgi:hypothetical protein